MKPLKSSQRWLRLAPLLANVPILVGLSYAIRTALTMPGSPLPEAGFLWVEKLGSVDVGIGIAGLLVTFLNAEVQSRNSLKLLEKEEAATAAREEQLQLQESLAAERERQDAKRKQAMRDVLRPVKRDRADAKPAPLPIKAMTKAATAKKSQRQAVRPVTPAPPTQASASSRAQPFADGRGGSVIPQDIPRTPAGVWAWAKEKFEKTLSPAYTLHIFSKLSRAYGVGFFVLASMFVPSVSRGEERTTRCAQLMIGSEPVLAHFHGVHARTDLGAVVVRQGGATRYRAEDEGTGPRRGQVVPAPATATAPRPSIGLRRRPREDHSSCMREWAGGLGQPQLGKRGG